MANHAFTNQFDLDLITPFLTMRHLTLIFATSIALHASHNHVAEATGAASKTNQDHPFLEAKNDIRGQRFLRSNRSSDHDERMLAWEPVLHSSMPAVNIFERIREVAKGATPIEEFHNVLQTMKTEDMELVLAAFKEEETLEKGVSLVDRFIAHWGIEAVATVLVQAKTSDNSVVVGNGNKLLQNLMESLDNKAHGNYDAVFRELEITPKDAKQFAVRVELLDDYIKFKSDGQPNDNALFRTLRKRFQTFANLARIIALVKAEDKSAEALETRFVNYFVVLGDSSTSFFSQLFLPIIVKKGLREYQFEMMEKFSALKDEEEMLIPDRVLDAFIEGVWSEGQLAIMFSKAVGSPDFEGILQKYEGLLFDRWNRDRIDPDVIDNIFTELASAPLVKERYRMWLAGKDERKRKWLAEIGHFMSERKRKKIA